MRGRGPRSRRHHHGHWRVLARVERFAEPALLLLLRERPAHGYDLLERLPELTGEARVEMGNLYRLMRGLEEEGLVSSEWDASSPGPAKRRYALTSDGAKLKARSPIRSVRSHTAHCWVVATFVTLIRLRV